MQFDGSNYIVGLRRFAHAFDAYKPILIDQRHDKTQTEKQIAHDVKNSWLPARQRNIVIAT